jgi:hypothetical protein
VNLTGPAVDLDIDTVLAPGGELVDATAGRYFPDLATHMLWNAPTAASVSIGGLAQLPGSLLVPNGSSTTTLTGAGTNGRVLVAGDLVHAGPGHLHSYPFLRNPDLSCGPEVEHFGAVTLDVVFKDPRDLVDGDRVFRGTFSCRLEGDDVTPGDGTWSARPGGETQVLTGRVPVGAVCQLSEQLEGVPSPGWNWAEPEIAPDKLVVAKRDPRGFTVVNAAVAEPPPPPPPPPPTSTPTPTPTTVVPEPSPTVPSHEPTADPTPTAEPTSTPDPLPSSLPTPDPDEPSAGAPDDVPNAGPEPPQRPGNPGPLTTTAPFTLRGAFVWGPLLLLSVLALRLRAPWQRKRRRLH